MIPSFPVYLFDVDGVLLDSAPDICGAVHQVMIGKYQLDLDYDLLKSYIGRHLYDLFADVIPDITGEQAKDLLAAYREIYHSNGHQRTRLYPGVRETLEKLGGRKATATTKSTETAAKLLAMFEVDHCFHRIQGTDGFPAKPNPDVILRSLDAFGVSPADCLLVGDAEADMEAGRRAGVSICAVTYGYGKPERLARHQPDYTIHDIRELAPNGR